MIQVWINEDGENASALLEATNNLVSSHKSDGLLGFVMFIRGPETKPILEKLATEKNINSAVVTCLPKGKKDSALQRYRINPEAKNTILVYKRKIVTANFVNINAKKSFDKVEKAVAKMLE